MIDIQIELALDVAIIILLILTIAYCCRLNRNLKILRRNQDSLPQLALTLNEAAAKAEEAVLRLKSAGAATAEELRDAAENAQTRKDELNFVCEKAESLSNLMENTIYASRSLLQNQPAPATEPAAAAEPSVAPEPENVVPEPSIEPVLAAQEAEEPSEAENELLQALRSIK